jgi:hypothetical protein
VWCTTENSLCTLAPEPDDFDVKFVLYSCNLLSVKRYISCHLSALCANCLQYPVPGINRHGNTERRKSHSTPKQLVNRTLQLLNIWNIQNFTLSKSFVPEVLAKEKTKRLSCVRPFCCETSSVEWLLFHSVYTRTKKKSIPFVEVNGEGIRHSVYYRFCQKVT